jgi:hypothetical protein
MASGDFFILSILGFFFGLFSFFKGLKALKRKRLIEDTPTSKIRSIAMGPVEIYGQVVPVKGKILRSPFSNTECVFYRYAIQEYKKSGKSSRWVTVKKGQNGTHFYLRDDTGHVLVDPRGAEIDIPLDYGFYSGIGQDPPQEIKDFLKAHNLSFEGFLGINKKMRYLEYLITPRDKLYIMGTAGDNPFVRETWAKTGIEDIMIQKGKDGIYYISDKSEKKVLSSLRISSILGIYGGGILIIVCLFIILLYLKLI